MLVSGASERELARARRVMGPEWVLGVRKR